MAEPVLVGILSDMAASDADGASAAFEGFIRLALDPIVASGRIDRDVRFVHGHSLGLPGGTAHAVERAFADLAAQGVLAVVGPAIGDNALVATPLADRFGVPTINYAGTERARSAWMFHLQVGSHEDEPVVIARELQRLGVGRVGVIYDRSPIGRRYFGFLQAECEILGVRVAAALPIAPEPAAATHEAAALAAAGSEAIVYLGLGLALPAVVGALDAAARALPRLMNTCGLRGYLPDFARLIDGWTYVDMIADDNRCLAALRARLPAGVPLYIAAAFGYDMGTLIGEGLARAPELTRHGVRDGLEQIKWLPAAEGHEGTVLSFGTHDRGALHGRYLVLRQWREGESVEVG